MYMFYIFQDIAKCSPEIANFSYPISARGAITSEFQFSSAEKAKVVRGDDTLRRFDAADHKCDRQRKTEQRMSPDCAMR